jgi:hypothetical protein
VTPEELLICREVEALERRCGNHADSNAIKSALETIKLQSAQLTAASTRERALREKVEKLREVLIEGQFRYEDSGNQGGNYYNICWRCYGNKETGHRKDCKTGQALANETEAT